MEGRRARDSPVWEDRKWLTVWFVSTAAVCCWTDQGAEFRDTVAAKRRASATVAFRLGGVRECRSSGFVEHSPPRWPIGIAPCHSRAKNIKEDLEDVGSRFRRRARTWSFRLATVCTPSSRNPGLS